MAQDKYLNGRTFSRSNGNLAGSNNLKITAVGDGMVGKTCILITYTRQEFPLDYVPTVFDNFPKDITFQGVEYKVALWDTAGQEDYERLRPLSYPNTTCFLLCYSIISKSSYDNIVTKWHPELKKHCPNTPIILVATKCDLRGKPEEQVTLKEGRRMARKIGAYKHMESSAIENKGLDEIFDEAVKCSVTRVHPMSKFCVLL